MSKYTIDDLLDAHANKNHEPSFWDTVNLTSKYYKDNMMIEGFDPNTSGTSSVSGKEFIITGGRRIGKTHLAEEMRKHQHSYNRNINKLNHYIDKYCKDIEMTKDAAHKALGISAKREGE